MYMLMHISQRTKRTSRFSSCCSSSHSGQSVFQAIVPPNEQLEKLHVFFFWSHFSVVLSWERCVWMQTKPDEGETFISITVLSSQVPRLSKSREHQNQTKLKDKVMKTTCLFLVISVSLFILRFWQINEWEVFLILKSLWNLFWKK